MEVIEEEIVVIPKHAIEEDTVSISENGNKKENEEERPRGTKKKLGGLKTMPFIIANEACERFASIGFYGNMVTYLMKVLNLSLLKALSILNILSGTASFTPLVGALIADSFAGRFWTIVVASIIYVLGMMGLTISASLPSLHPPSCPTRVDCQGASNLQLWLLYVSLLLASIGTGGIQPCVVTFAADQIDMKKSSVESRKWNFFNWYSFCMGAATIAAFIIPVYLQDNVSWGWGLGIPTIVMVVSIVSFVVGSPLYNKVKAGGSPLVRLTQVIVAAVKKRNGVSPDDHSLLYQNKELDADISKTGRLLHTDQFKWLDKAAIVTESEKTETKPNLWSLATVHRVEELKSIMRVLPIWSTGILLAAAQSNIHNLVIQQARSMDRHLSHSFKIPPASLAVFSIFTTLLGLVAYERLFVPLARHFTGNRNGISCLQRMGIGFFINIIASIVSALVEAKRKSVAARHNLMDDPTALIPISVFWLLPQFCIHGIAEVFTSVGQLEFLYDQSPESMRSTAIALNSLTNSLGHYLGQLLLLLVKNWLPSSNINRGKLDYFYWLVGGIQLIDLVYYILCTWFYTYKHLEEAKDDEVVENVDVEISENLLSCVIGKDNPNEASEEVEDEQDVERHS